MVGAWVVGDSAVGWLEAVDGAERGWDADAAAAITSEGKGEQSDTDCVCGAGGTAAGVVLGVVRVEGGAVVGVTPRGVYMMVSRGYCCFF